MYNNYEKVVAGGGVAPPTITAVTIMAVSVYRLLVHMYPSA